MSDNPRERRISRGIQIECRNEDEAVKIKGVAAKVNERASIYPWMDEMIMPGAFDDCLEDDVRALMNHDANLILARTKSGTLELMITEEGHLGFSYDSPSRSYAKDLADSISTGDVDGCSFQFAVKEVAWEYGEQGEPDLRKIIRFERLYDVGPVTFPAYAGTSVQARSEDALKQEREAQKPGDGEKKVYNRNLQQLRIKLHKQSNQ
jgi:HK97 family phage prohead protease